MQVVQYQRALALTGHQSALAVTLISAASHALCGKKFYHGGHRRATENSNNAGRGQT
jgi:hypothetical protein